MEEFSPEDLNSTSDFDCYRGLKFPLPIEKFLRRLLASGNPEDLNRFKAFFPERFLKVPGAKNGLVLIRNLYDSSSTNPLLEVKVPILGMGALGKSILVRRLVDNNNSFQTNNPATHAFEVCGISLEVDRGLEKYNCSLRLFDFGGQPELHGAHRFFLADQRNVYVIVVSARLTREANRLDYWLRMVKYHGGCAPVVVVVTHCDSEPGAVRGVPSHDRAPLLLDAKQLSAEQNLFVRVVDGYSNVDGANIEEVRAALREAISQLDVVFSNSFTQGVFGLLNCLVDGLLPRPGHPLISERYWTVSGQFRAACESVGERDHQSQAKWLGLLRDLGYIHYVGDRAKLKRQPEHILRDYLFFPEWVKKLVYNVVRLEARQPGGIVSCNQVKSALHQDGMSELDVRLLWALMLEYDLIFRVPGGDPENPDYLVPDQVGVRPSDMTLTWTDDPRRKFRWHFLFLPDYLLAQLAGRWLNDQPEGFTCYRDDVILTKQNVKSRVQVHANFNNHTLDLEFDAGQGSEALKAQLTLELENLLDPEGLMKKPCWTEEDLSNPPEPIDNELVTKIAELLLSMEGGSTSPDCVKGVADVVRNLFVYSNVLTPAEKLAFRISYLYGYVKADFLIGKTKLPQAVGRGVKNVFKWLDGPGREIKKCFVVGKLKTLNSADSFRKSYASACKSLKIDTQQFEQEGDENE